MLPSNAKRGKGWGGGIALQQQRNRLLLQQRQQHLAALASGVISFWLLAEC
jgi:hypothetical protein